MMAILLFVNDIDEKLLQGCFTCASFEGYHRIGDGGLVVLADPLVKCCPAYGMARWR